MNKREARNKLLLGYFVRHASWDVGYYLRYDEEGLCCRDNCGGLQCLNSSDDPDEDWELHEEPPPVPAVEVVKRYRVTRLPCEYCHEMHPIEDLVINAEMGVILCHKNDSIVLGRFVEVDDE